MLQTSLTPGRELEQRGLLCEMLRLFYDKGWVSGTGGGICATLDDGNLLVAPTGVHKERVQPDDLFLVDPASGAIVRPPLVQSLRPSECTPIFRAVIRARAAGSVVHSHALSAVLAADLAEEGALAISRLEMLKGIRGAAFGEAHLLPVIVNTPRESELTDQVETALADPRFASAYAVLVKDHGAYIWGIDVWEAKRHTEVYHFLFEAVKARRA
jgi:methylthioribulose-1-phosphate dehydratase